MKSVLVIVLLAGTASAAPVAVDTIVRERIGAALPAELGIVEVHLPSSLASLATEPDRVAVELPRALVVGRVSARVSVKGRSTVFVPVSIGKTKDVVVVHKKLAAGSTITAEDIRIERRATSELGLALPSMIIGSSATRELAVGATIAKSDIVLAPQLPRGTQVTVEMRRGRVRVRGTATLEAAARSGEPVAARLAHTRTIVRGTLQSQTLIVGDAP